VKARIRDKLVQRRALLDTRTDTLRTIPVGEEYFTPQQVADRLKLHPDTVKALFRNETNGIIRIGNRISTRNKKRYVVERYSASAVERLVRRLELTDPRYSQI
jgi:hypothetical protein